jgi:hypothetical protein
MNQSIYLSIYLSINLSVYLSIYLSWFYLFLGNHFFFSSQALPGAIDIPGGSTGGFGSLPAGVSPYTSYVPEPQIRPGKVERFWIPSWCFPQKKMVF